MKFLSREVAKEVETVEDSMAAWKEVVKMVGKVGERMVGWAGQAAIWAAGEGVMVVDLLAGDDLEGREAMEGPVVRTAVEMQVVETVLEGMARVVVVETVLGVLVGAAVVRQVVEKVVRKVQEAKVDVVRANLVVPRSLPRMEDPPCSQSPNPPRSQSQNPSRSQSQNLPRSQSQNPNNWRVR